MFARNKNLILLRCKELWLLYPRKQDYFATFLRSRGRNAEVLQRKQTAKNGSQIRFYVKITDRRFQQTAESLPKTENSLPKRPEIVVRKPNFKIMDGNTAAAHVAYACSEISFIYPISPATSMGEKMDEWTSAGRKNVFGQTVSVNMMQSEAGSAGALHGAASAGALTSTFTAAQGLLLMVPNMYLLAGELVPTVFYVAARSVSKHALSIFNDHSDVMSVRQTGFAMMCSSSVQEVMDLALVSHLASVRARLPFVHFFDGYRTSAEMQKIDAIQYEAIEAIYPFEDLKQNLLKTALNPTHPRVRGSQMRPDIFMQSSVAGHKYYKEGPAVIDQVMQEVSQLTGRPYNLFDYHGSPEAERVVVLMGSASKTMMETVDYLNSRGENVGVITTRLFRPWSAEHFYNVLPETARKIAVLDRTREEGASGSPLFLDVCVSLGDRNDMRLVTGGQYGLASKEFTPTMGKAVFDNLNSPNPKMRYVIGIEDDVTKTSLPYESKNLHTVPEGTKQCIFFGVGGDGMVGASQNMIELIGGNTHLNAQGHFVYDSKKTDGLTTSHLRFGPKPINSSYCITDGAHLAICSHPSYVNKFDFLLDALVKNGLFILNCPWKTLEELEAKLPAWFKRQIAEKDIEFYTIDATKVADAAGLGKKRVNTILAACFYDLSGVLPRDEAITLLKKSIEDMYKHKGPKIVKMNQKAVDAAIGNKIRVEYPRDQWLQALDPPVHPVEFPEYVSRVTNPVLAMKGDSLPVSAFEAGGSQPTGTTAYEHRGLAPEIPVWDADKCTQCNYCSIVCPHAVVRPFLLDRQESKAAPEGFEFRKAKGGSEVAGLNYTIKIAPYDCTGCAVCVQACPDDALKMMPTEEAAKQADPWWTYATTDLKPKGTIGDRFSVKGSQFQKPLLEFSAACSGCGETPYVKLATQLFGDRMMVANATGCSSIWGAVATAIPYTKNEKGYGPAWGSSLFEDNAEYGLGMMVGMRQRRQRLANDIKTALKTLELPQKLKDGFTKWLQFISDNEKCDVYSELIQHELHDLPQPMDPLLKSIMDREDILRTTSQWIIGGDGWAYDIGFGGLDHVLSLSGENVNLMVLDTEMYSNTGGQMSKSTPTAAVVKYASSGKPKTKKNLALHAINYGHAYVASIALGANYAHCVEAMTEAESFQGPSLLLAYSPCIDWGFDMKHMMDVQKQAVDCGYWTLFRYDPRRVAQGVNPFQLDSKRVRSDLRDYIKGQNRFTRLTREDTGRAELLQHKLKDKSLALHDRFEHMAMDDEELLGELMEKMHVTSSEFLHREKSIILYGSETGNAHHLAEVFQQELKRRQLDAKVESMDNMDVEDLSKYKNIYCVVSTAGQGEFPVNAQDFWNHISEHELPHDLLKESRFAVFGLGDSGYLYFNEAAKRIDHRLEELGAQRLVPLGMGDDKDEEKYETKWTDWQPDLWDELGAPTPSEELLPPSYQVRLDNSGAVKAPLEHYLPPGAQFLPLLTNELLTPPNYDRIIRHYEFDIRQKKFQYNVADALGMHPHNKPEAVEEFLTKYGILPDSVCLMDDTQGRKAPLPAVIEARQLFTEVLDIFGRPTRRFYETLAMVAQDEAEKTELRHLLTREGQKDYQRNAKETVTYADLLEKYKSTKMGLDYLIDFIPTIKPRLYSIASSMTMHPDLIQLCIVKDDWTTPSGRYREGLCTQYIEKKSLDHDLPVDHIACRLSPAGINIPDSQKPPYVMVALGTGIAPMRSMVQEREMARRAGEKVGEMALFFGARHRVTDYTYGDEFEDYHSNGKGVLSFLETAFSRDQDHKIYVQHRIDENQELVYDYLVKKGGYFFLCGPAGNVPKDVRNSIKRAFEKCGGMGEEESEKRVAQMQIEGKYNVEAW